MDVNASRMINLNGYNYAIWKRKMEDLFYVKGYHAPIFGSDKIADKTDEDWTLFHK